MAFHKDTISSRILHSRQLSGELRALVEPYRVIYIIVSVLGPGLPLGIKFLKS